MSEFYYLHVSPWSEKARWAMDFSKISYQKCAFTPMVTTPLVRLKSLNFTKKVTVPSLINENETLVGSYTIAQHAERKSLQKRQSNDLLFPAEYKNKIDQWEALSDELLQAGRALVCIRMRHNKSAKLMSLPPAIPLPIRPFMLPVANIGLYYLKAKYGFEWDKYDEYIEIMRRILKQVQSSLADADYLLGQFTYADITMAVTLQMIKPVGVPFIPLDKHTESCWITPELQEEFEDLIAWRDRIYKRHRTIK